MNTKNITLLFWLLLLVTPVIGQIEDADYQAYKINKNVRDDIPIKIHVERFAQDFCWFTDAETKNPLEGKYHIIKNIKKYHVVNLTKGFINGDYEYYFDNKLQHKINYEGGRRHGKSIFYYENGKIESEYTYKRQEYTKSLTIHSISYHENGQPKEELQYDENGKRHGKTVQYDENGIIIKQQEYKQGRLVGQSTEKESNGKTISKEYNNGFLISESRFYANGNIEYQKQYESKKEKIRTGKWIQAKENGELESETHYLQNKKDGEEKIYYTGNKLKSIIEYTQDRHNGKEIVYEEEPHVIRHEGTWKDGERHGIFKTYHNGVLWKETTYNEDKVISEKQYENGKLQLLNLLDESGTLVNVEKYDSQGSKTYRNNNYKKHPSIKIKEDASGITDVYFE